MPLDDNTLAIPGFDFEPPPADEPEPMPTPGEDDAHTPEPARPINWNLLTAEEAQVEWLELNAWINWLRHTYGLSVGVIPPLWHRHSELIWELSALRQHWLSAYDPKQHGSAPIGWHRDFADAKQRLHDWVSACGTRLDSDRPTRQVAWPGEDPAPTVEDSTITDRDEDFVHFVRDDIARRRAAEDAFYAQLTVDR